jgi:tRNA(Ile)-lysidine synthase
MSPESNFLERLSTGLDNASVPNGSTLIVAFSGGPDSSALLSGIAGLRNKRKFTLLAAHINHQIRPESADNDQIAAQEIAASLDVEFIAKSVDVPAVSALGKISIEQAARQSRYEILAQIVNDRAAYGVVTGHTRDDQAETVLLHAARGAGLRGISGMKHASVLKIPGSKIELNVIRPMLDTPRTECIEFCKLAGITPVIDESNSSRDYTRNKIRLDVLPVLNEASSGSSDALARLAKNAADDLEIIDWVVNRYLIEAKSKDGLYSRSATDGLPGSLVARMLMRAYESYAGHAQNLERVHVSDMVRLLAGQSGTSIELPNGVIFYVDKNEFGFTSKKYDDCPFPDSLSATEMRLPGTTDLSGGFTINAELVNRPQRLEDAGSQVTYATPDLLSHALTLRNRRNGDRFQPLGMDPLVKLQDFFVGAGVPERWRDRVPIIESERGIIWVAGYRLAEWAKVLSTHTQVARMELVAPLAQDANPKRQIKKSN